jgi:hypothetical protein
MSSPEEIGKPSATNKPPVALATATWVCARALHGPVCRSNTASVENCKSQAQAWQTNPTYSSVGICICPSAFTANVWADRLRKFTTLGASHYVRYLFQSPGLRADING